MSKEKPVSPEATKAPQQNNTELSDSDLGTVTGGDSKPKGGDRSVHHSEFTIVKLVDVATPKLF